MSTGWTGDIYFPQNPNNATYGPHRRPKRPREMEVEGGNRTISVVDQNAQQYGRSKLSYSRRRKANASQLVHSAKESRYMRLQGISTFGVGPGYVRCDLSSTDPVTQPVNWPLWLFDLKATNNVEDGVFRAGVVAWRLTSASQASTSNITFSNNYNSWQNSDGTVGASAVWQPENYSATADGSVQPHRKVFLDYVQGKFIFYGANQRPVRWRVELIKLNHDWLHPDFVLTTDPVADASINLLNERNMFWQALTKPFVTSPINAQNPKYRKYFTTVRVLMDKVLEPKLETEPDLDVGATAVPVPHMHQLNYFERMGVTCKYDWNDDGLSAWRTNSFQQNVGQTRSNVDFKDRVYLMIRALAPIVNSNVTSTGVDPNQDPSFDIILRKKEVMLNA